MAQARRRRRTKHRGNAAGVIEVRGRTGRKPTSAEKGGRGADPVRGREKREQRYDRPPTWRAAFYRAMIAGVFLLLASLLLLKQPAQAIALFPIVIGLYTLMSYYMDLWIYRRRMRRKQSRGRDKAAAR
jgi:hypothetical protein